MQGRRSIALALGILMMLGASSCGSGATDHPLDASFTGEAHWEITDQCEGITTLVDDASGEDPDLGSITTNWAHCPEDNAVDDGRMTIVDDNGDEVRGTYDYPRIDGGAPITFEGGTGRFAEATGTATIIYSVDITLREDCDQATDPFMCLTNSPWTATLTGTVNY